MPPKRRRGKAGSEADDSSGDEYGRPKKSVRRTAARGKGKKGGSFSKVPIDVLYEIFCLLHPKDLLRLSWCNQFLRSVLTSKSSRFVWAAVLSAVEGLPPCPQDLTEIAYSNILFHPYCYNCAKSRPAVNWFLYRRICKKCILEVGIGLESAWDEIKSAGCPLTITSSYDLYKVLPWEDENFFFMPEDIDRFIRDLRAAKSTIKLEGPDQDSVESRYRKALSMRGLFCDAMKDWEYLEKVNQETARKGVRSARVDQIIARLRETEWSDEVARQMGRHWAEDIPGANVAKPLTNKEWAKLQQPINQYMERLRSHRISNESHLKRMARAHDISSVLAEYRNALESPHSLPSAGDIHTLPGVRDILLDGTDEEFAALKSDIVSRLPQLTAQCYEERRTTLMELLPERLRTRDALFLASTSFSCEPCSTRELNAREAIHHTCGYYNWGPDTRTLLSVEENPWSKTLKGLSYCSSDAGSKEKIVLAVGEDPATITDAGMDLGGHRFLAYSQSGGSSGSLNVLSWRGLSSKLYFTPSIICWRHLRPDEMSDFVVRVPFQEPTTGLVSIAGNRGPRYSMTAPWKLSKNTSSNVTTSQRQNRAWIIVAKILTNYAKLRHHALTTRLGETSLNGRPVRVLINLLVSLWR